MLQINEIECFFEQENIKYTIARFIKKILGSIQTQDKTSSILETENNSDKLFYILEKTYSHYKEIFNNEYVKISALYERKRDNSIRKFSCDLKLLYSWLKTTSDPEYSCSKAYSTLKSPTNLLILYHVNDIVKRTLQMFFIDPLLSFIESNYYEVIVEECVFPFRIEQLINALQADSISFRKHRNFEELLSKNVLYSSHHHCLYSFTYNNFSNPCIYKKYMEVILNQFEDCLNGLNTSISSVNSRLKIYYNIKRKIIEIKALFTEHDSKLFNISRGIATFTKQCSFIDFKQMLDTRFILDDTSIFVTNLVYLHCVQYQCICNAFNLTESRIKLIKMTTKFDSVNHEDSDKKEDIEPLLHKKLKTNLTVPEIGFLLRCLSSEKDILVIQNKSDLFRKMSKAVTSQKQESISPDSLKNKFNMPEEKAIEFWIEKFTHFLQFAKNIRENLQS